MEEKTVYRILDALYTFQHGAIPHDAQDDSQTIADVNAIRKRYEEIKHKVGFAKADRIAKAEFMMKVLEAA